MKGVILAYKIFAPVSGNIMSIRFVLFIWFLVIFSNFTFVCCSCNYRVLTCACQLTKAWVNHFYLMTQTWKDFEMEYVHITAWRNKASTLLQINRINIIWMHIGIVATMPWVMIMMRNMLKMLPQPTNISEKGERSIAINHAVWLR